MSNHIIGGDSTLVTAWLTAKGAFGDQQYLNYEGRKMTAEKALSSSEICANAEADTVAGGMRITIANEQAIKNMLIDQKFISGIGNIYASEILNYAKISPLKLSCEINDIEINKIIFFTKKVLRRSIKIGGTSINNFLSIKGNKGSYQKEFRVYDRENEKCKNKLCSGKILKINMSNRSTYLCNNCQK